MKARYASTCGHCSKPIPIGADIGPVGQSGYGRKQRTSYGHASCSAIWQNGVREEAGEWFC